MIEPVPILDIYAEDVAAVEIMGSNVRLWFCVRQRGETLIVAKLVMPLAAIRGELPAMIEDARKCPGKIAYDYANWGLGLLEPQVH